MLYYSTDLSPDAHRAEKWDEAVGGALFPLRCRFPSANPFHGQLKSWDFGNISLAWFDCTGVQYSRQAGRCAAGDEEMVLVSFPILSEVEFSQGGVSLSCAQGQFFAERSGVPYDYVQPKHNETWVLKLKLRTLSAHAGPLDRFFGRNFDSAQGVGGLLLDMIRLAPVRLKDVPAPLWGSVGQTIMELLTLAIEGDDRVVSSRMTAVHQAHLVRIERYLRENLANPALAPRLVAQACGISVRYLHNLCKESGVSIGDRIRELRLEACKAQLSDPLRNESLAQICYRWGYSDQAQFSRHFRARFGLTPRDARARAIAASTAGQRDRSMTN
ncbi:helix-turn-helix domain-containing protein [Bradyrhizobium sp. LTSPM299]|jgi:AraC-like DNA-binding protein|uniref:helix-turn-helix domain-containing protein n=1 Tax=Bradyrhizobium sp. LTSPM299 TaxID=1619233 RepID=UPI0005C96FC0|nr:helix-turn-helix domain-containing protein [Bradyrhizobium sp. LTSPM299]